jgi:hypothetical protein
LNTEPIHLSGQNLRYIRTCTDGGMHQDAIQILSHPHVKVQTRTSQCQCAKINFFSPSKAEPNLLLVSFAYAFFRLEKVCSVCTPPVIHSVSVVNMHGLINFIDTKAKCCHLKKLPVKFCSRGSSECIAWRYF